jgi:Zn-dependent protease with chaperone function
MEDAMLIKVFNHFRLIWRLMCDKRISAWLKLFLVTIPLIYVVLPFPIAIPIPDDLLPVVGFIDDLLLFVVTTIIFTALCSRTIVDEHEMALAGRYSSADMSKLETYRDANETRDLAIGFLLTIGFVLLGGWLAGVLLLFVFGMGYLWTVLQRSAMLANAVQVSEIQLPHLHKVLQRALVLLPSVQVNLFVTQNPMVNAYTFGYSEPYTVVLTSALVEKLDEQEIQAVIGHELGHILFGHARVMSILGTQGGIGRLMFYKWRRSCEYSADAIAWLASGNDVVSVISAYLKLASGLQNTIDVQAFLAQLDKASESTASKMEMLSTHPFIRNRIQNLLRLSTLTSQVS